MNPDGSPMGIIGCLGEFHRDREILGAYVEQLEMFFTANSIVEVPDDENHNRVVLQRKRVIFLTEAGCEVYEILKNVLVPIKLMDTPLMEISTTVLRPWKFLKAIILEYKINSLTTTAMPMDMANQYSREFQAISSQQTTEVNRLQLKSKRQLGLKASATGQEGWLTRFKHRPGIRQLDVTGETKSADNEAAQNYSRTFAEMVQEKKLTADQIYNANETGLLWKCLPTAMLAAAGEKEAVGFKMNKEGLTILNCANASGGHRLSLLVIDKSRKPRALKGIAHLPISYKAQKSTWMDKGIFMEWFSTEFVPQVRENMKTIGKPNGKCVLLLDNCRAHPHESKLVSSCGNIFACYLSPNVTSLIQPMDQGVIQNFKCHYRNNFTCKLINSDQSISDSQRAYNIKDAIYACSLAGRELKNITLKTRWHKLWPNVIFENSASDDEEFEGFHVWANKKQVVKEIVEIVSSAHETNALKSLAEDDIVK
uniref:jerky protein homolog n=1 Tax=Pristiophorus japonicus TaxID=55135 RepID=UPI00398EFE75